jgi:5'-3' exonuclease
MGVRGLYTFLKQQGCSISIDEITKMQPKRIGIDISYYMYRLQGDSKRVIDFINSLKPHKILLIFDGRAPNDKQHEHNRRKQIREDDLSSAKALRESLLTCELSEEQRSHLEKKAVEFEKKGWQNTREIRHAFKKALYDAEIPLLKSKGEADPLLVSLATASELDIVISGDMDLLVLGVTELWYPLGITNNFWKFDRNKVLADLKLTDMQFRGICAMCCTDYVNTDQKLDILSAYQAMRIYKSVTTIKEKHATWLTEWPSQSHPFLIGVGNPDLWILDEQLAWYNAWKNGEKMPYHDDTVKTNQ